MTESGASPGPGWHIDSSGVQRWWDGERWTDFTKPPSDDDANYEDVRDALADVWRDVLVAVSIVLGVMGVAIGFGPLLFSVFGLAFGVGACAMGWLAANRDAGYVVAVPFLLGVVAIVLGGNGLSELSDATDAILRLN